MVETSAELGGECRSVRKLAKEAGWHPIGGNRWRGTCPPSHPRLRLQSLGQLKETGGSGNSSGLVTATAIRAETCTEHLRGGGITGCYRCGLLRTCLSFLPPPSTLGDSENSNFRREISGMKIRVFEATPNPEGNLKKRKRFLREISNQIPQSHGAGQPNISSRRAVVDHHI